MIAYSSHIPYDKIESIHLSNKSPLSCGGGALLIAW